MASKSCLYEGAKFEISYEIVNPSKGKSILILHGWGSNKDIMKQAFGKRLAEYRHIYLDLPGFGKSENNTILTSRDYASIVRVFLENICIKPEAIIGHSFGGKVATLLNPKYLILLSSSGVLVPKSLSIRAKIATVKALSPFGLSMIRRLFVSADAKGMSHAMYETFKNIVDEDFEHNFENFTGQAMCFWGKSDTATPLWTGEKIVSMIGAAKFYPLDGDHFFFMQHCGYIEERIEELC